MISLASLILIVIVICILLIVETENPFGLPVLYSHRHQFLREFGIPPSVIGAWRKPADLAEQFRADHEARLVDVAVRRMNGHHFVLPGPSLIVEDVPIDEVPFRMLCRCLQYDLGE